LVVEVYGYGRKKLQSEVYEAMVDQGRFVNLDHFGVFDLLDGIDEFGHPNDGQVRDGPNGVVVWELLFTKKEGVVLESVRK